MPQTITFPIGLGDEVRDRVTGYTGVVVALTEWFGACQRATVQPALDASKPADIPKCESFDVMQLEVIGENKIARPPASKLRSEEKPAGPMPDVTR